MVLTSDDTSEDDDDDIYTCSAARLKALMKKAPPPAATPVVICESSIDCEQDVPPISTNTRARRRPNTRSSAKSRPPSTIEDVPDVIPPRTESITLDDSDESDVCEVKDESSSGYTDKDDKGDEDEDYSVDVKVRWKSQGIVRLELKRHQTFEKIFKHFGEMEGVSEKRVLLLRSSKPLLPTDTPASINLRVIDILEGGIVNTEVEHEKPKDDMCQIKVPMSTKEKIVIDLKKNETFERVITICAEKLDVEESRIKLSFDGEEIGANDTPESLELEDEACIDLRVATLV